MIYAQTRPDPHAVGRHYDELDRFYREVWGEHLHHGLWRRGDETPEVAARQLVDEVARQAGLQPGNYVCDVGCGYGGTARILAQEYGAQVTAYTVSQAQYDYACAQGNEGNPVYCLQDWLANDLPDAHFDAVVAIESLSHMADKARFFTEAYRVLRPGGRLVLCAWLAYEYPSPWQVRHLLEPICTEGQLPSLGSAAEYYAMMDAAGFAPAAFTDLSHHVARTWTICLRRVLHGLLTHPAYLAFLLDPRHHNRTFTWSLFRIPLAYRTGAFRYGLFVARKSDTPRVQSDQLFHGEGSRSAGTG
jgi:tocopherol O-methyltransferase